MLYAFRTPGSVSIPGAPKVPYSTPEEEVANIASIRFWPALFPKGAKDGIVIDRVRQFAIPNYGASNAKAHFSLMANGKTGYKTTALAQALSMKSFNTLGSFTVGCVCANHLAFGSTSAGLAGDAQAPWGIVSPISGSGLIRMDFGSLSAVEAVSNGWTKKLTADKLTAVVLIFDRSLGRITMRYDGEEVWRLDNDLVKTVGLKPELCMGALKLANQAAEAARPMHTNAFFAFESALSGADLISVEKVLLSAAALA